MAISDHMVMQMKNNQPNWKGSPEMKEKAEKEAWPAAKEVADNLDEMSAVDLLLFYHDWFGPIGYSNMGRILVAMINAYAVERSQNKESEPA